MGVWLGLGFSRTVGIKYQVWEGRRNVGCFVLLLHWMASPSESSERRAFCRLRQLAVVRLAHLAPQLRENSLDGVFATPLPESSKTSRFDGTGRSVDAR